MSSSDKSSKEANQGIEKQMSGVGATSTTTTTTITCGLCKERLDVIDKLQDDLSAQKRVIEILENRVVELKNSQLYIANAQYKTQISSLLQDKSVLEKTIANLELQVEQSQASSVLDVEVEAIIQVKDDEIARLQQLLSASKEQFEGELKAVRESMVVVDDDSTQQRTSSSSSASANVAQEMLLSKENEIARLQLNIMIIKRDHVIELNSLKDGIESKVGVELKKLEDDLNVEKANNELLQKMLDIESTKVMDLEQQIYITRTNENSAMSMFRSVTKSNHAKVVDDMTEEINRYKTALGDREVEVSTLMLEIDALQQQLLSKKTTEVLQNNRQYSNDFLFGQKISSLLLDKSELTNKVLELSFELKKLMMQNKSLSNQVDDRKAEVARYQVALSNKEAEEVALMQQILSMQELQAKEAKKSHEAISSEKRSSEELLRQLVGERRLIIDLKRQLSSIQADYELKIKALKNDKAELETRISELTTLHQSDVRKIADLTEDLRKVTSDKDAMITELDEKDDAIALLQVALSNKEAESIQMTQHMKAVEKRFLSDVKMLSEAISSDKMTIEELQKQLEEERRKIADLKGKINDKEGDHSKKVKVLLIDKSDLQNQILEMEKIIRKEENKNVDLSDDISKLQAQLKSVTAQLEEKKVEIARYQVALSNKEAEALGLIRQIQSLQEHAAAESRRFNDAISVERQSKEELHRQLDDAALKVSELKRQLSSDKADHEDKVKSLLIERNDLENRIQEKDKVNGLKEKKILELSDDVKKLTAERDSLRVKLGEKDAEIARYQVALSNKEAEVVDLLQQMQSIKGKIAADAKKFHDALSAERKSKEELQKQIEFLQNLLDQERRRSKDLMDELTQKDTEFKQKVTLMSKDSADMERSAAEKDNVLEQIVKNYQSQILKLEESREFVSTELRNRDVEVRHLQGMLSNSEAQASHMVIELQAFKQLQSDQAQKIDVLMTADKKNNEELLKLLEDERMKVKQLLEKYSVDTSALELKISQLEKELVKAELVNDDIRNKLESCKDDLKVSETQNKYLQAQNEFTIEEIGEAKKEIGRLKVLLINKESEVAGLLRQIQSLKDQHSAEVKQLDDVISKEKETNEALLKEIEYLKELLEQERRNNKDLAAQLISQDAEFTQRKIVMSKEKSDLEKRLLEMQFEMEKKVSELNDKLDKVETLKESLQVQLNEKKAEISRYQAIISNKDAEIADFILQIKTLREQHVVEMNKMDELVSFEMKANEELQKQIDDERKKVVELKEVIQSKDVEHQAHVKTILKEKSHLEEQIVSMKQLLEKSEKKVIDLLDEVKKLQLLRDTLRKQLGEKDSAIARYQVVLSNKEAEVLDLTQQIQSLKQQHAVEVKKLNDAISADKKVIEGLQKQLDEERKTIADLKEDMAAQVEALEQQIKSLWKDKSELEKKIVSISRDREVERNRNVELSDDLKKMNSQNKLLLLQLDEKKGEITRYQVVVSSKEAEIAGLLLEIQSLKDQHSAEVKQLDDVILTEKETNEALLKEIEYLKELLEQERRNNKDLAAQLISQDAEFTQRIIVLSKEKSDLEKRLLEMQTTINRLEKKVSELNDKLDKVETLKESIQVQLNEKKAEISRYQTIISDKDAEIADLILQIKTLREQHVLEVMKLTETVSSLETSIEDLQRQIDDERKAVIYLKEQLVSQKSDYELKVKSLSADIVDLKNRVSQFEITTTKLNDEIKRNKVELEALRVQLNEKDNLIARYHAALSNKEAEALDLTQQIQSLKQQHAVEVKKLNDAILADKKVIDGLQKQLEEERRIKADLETEIDTKSAELKKKVDVIKELEDRLANLKQVIAQKDIRIAELIDQLKRSEAATEALRPPLKEKDTVIIRYQTVLSNKEAEIDHLNEQIRLLQLQLSTYTLQLDESNVTKKQSDDDFQRQLDEERKKVRDLMELLSSREAELESKVQSLLANKLELEKKVADFDAALVLKDKTIAAVNDDLNAAVAREVAIQSKLSEKENVVAKYQVALSNKEAEVEDLTQQIQYLQEQLSGKVQKLGESISSGQKSSEEFQKLLDDERKKVLELKRQLSTEKADFELRVKSLVTEKSVLETELSDAVSTSRKHETTILEIKAESKKWKSMYESTLVLLNDKEYAINRYQVALSNKEAEVIDLSQQILLLKEQHVIEVQKLTETIYILEESFEDLRKQLEEERKNVADLRELVILKDSEFGMKVKALLNDKSELLNQITELEKVNDELERKLMNISTELKKVEGEKETLRMQCNDRDNMITRYQLVISNKEAEVDDLTEQNLSLSEEIARLNELLSSEKKAHELIIQILNQEREMTDTLKAEFSTQKLEYESKIKIVSEEKVELNSRISDLQAKIEQLVIEAQQFETRIDSVRQQVVEKDNVIARYQVEFSNKEAEVTDLINQIELLKKQSAIQVKTSEETISALIKTTEELQKQLADERMNLLNLKESFSSEVERYEKNISSLKNDKAELESRISELTTLHQSDVRKIADLTEDLRKVTAEKDAMITELDEKDDMIARYQVALSNKEAESLELTLQMKSMEDRHTVEVKKLNDAISANKKLIEELQKQLEEERKKIDALKDDLSAQIALLEQKVRSLVKDKLDLETLLSEKDKVIEQKQKTIDDLTDELMKAQTQNKLLRLQLVDKDAEIARYQVALSNKEAEVVDLLQQIQSLQNPSNTSSVDNARDAVSAAKKYYEDLQKQLEDERRKVVELNGQLTSLEADYELKIKALKNDKAELETRNSELTTLRQGDTKKIADLTEDLRKVTAEKDTIVDELDEKDDTIARYQVALSNKEAETIDLAQQMQFQEDRNAAEVKRLNQSIAFGVKTIEELQKQLEEERKKITDLEEDLSSQISVLQQKVKSLSSDKIELEKNIIDLNFSLDSERRHVVELDDDLQKTDAKLTFLQLKLDDKDAEIKRYQVALTNKEAEVVDLLQQMQSLKDQIAADAKKFQDALSAERKSKEELQKQLVDEQKKVVDLKEQLASESAEHEEKVKSLLMDKSALELKVSQLELSNERHRNQIAELNDELLKSEARLNSLQVKLSEKDAEIARYQVALSNKEAEVVDLLQQIQSLQNPSNASSVDNARDDAVSAAKKYYDELQKQLEDERRKVVGLNGQLSTLEADYELKIKALKNDKAELETRISELTTLHQSDVKKIADLTEDLRKVTAEKDVMITELDEKDDMIARYQVALSNKEAESLELTLQMKSMEDRHTVEVKKLNDAISAHKKVIEELRKQLEEERKKIADLKEDIAAQIALLEQKIKSLLVDKADLEKKASLLQLDFDRGTQRNVELSDDVKKADNRIKSLQDKLDDKDAEIKRYQVALTNKEAEVVDLLQQMQSLKDQIAADAKKFQDALSAERKSKEELQKQLVDEQKKVVDLKEQLESDSAEHEEKVKSLLMDKLDLWNRVSEKDKAIDLLDGRIKELSDELKKVILEKEAIASQLIERDNTIALYQVALNNKEAESLELTLQMKSMEDRHAVKVKKLNDAISADKKVIEELQKQLEEERKKIADLKDDMSAQIVALEAKIKSLLVDKEELTDILSDEVKINEQHQKTIDDLTDELMKAQTQNKLLRLQLDDKDAEIARYQVTLSNKEAEVVDLLQQIQSLQNPSNTSSVDNPLVVVADDTDIKEYYEKQLVEEQKKADALQSQTTSKEAEYEAIIKALKNDKSTLEGKISDIEQVVKKHENSIDSLEEDLKVTIAQKNALQTLLDSKDGVISGYQVALTNKEAEYLELMQQISSLKELLLEEESKLKDLKSSEQIARDKLQQELDSEMKKSIAAKDQQVSEKADFESKIKSLEKDKSDLDNRVSDMDSVIQQKDKVIVDLNDDISKLQAQLKSVTAQLEEKKVEIARYQVTLSNKEAEMIEVTQQIQSVKEQHAHEVKKLNEAISSEKKTIDDLQRQLDEERAKAVALVKEQLNEKIKALMKDKADLEQLLSELKKTNNEITDDLKKADSQNKYLKAQHEYNVQELEAKDIEIARYQVVLSNKEAESVDLTQQVQSTIEQKAVETKRLSETIAMDKKVIDELKVQLDEDRKKIADLKELLSTKEREYEDKLRSLVDEKSELDELMLEIDKVSKGQISQLKDTTKQLDIQNKSIGNQLEEKKQEIARYQVVLSNKEAEVLDLTQQIQSLKQQHAVEVKKLNDAISADKKVMDGLQKQLEEERKKVADLKELVASKDAELVQKMSSLIDDQSELENRISEYQGRITDLGDYSQKLEQQFLSVNSQLEEKIREITRYQAALSNKEAESEELVQQLRILRDGQSSETKTDLPTGGGGGGVQLLQ